LTPGTVVRIKDPSDSGALAEVEKSQYAYDSRTLGVVSETPKLTLGDPGDEGAVEVALAGRVMVNVTTHNGNDPIAVGDMLTASDIPGVAMKATKAGLIIGRALEAYSGTDEGTVLAFVQSGYGHGTNINTLLPLGLAKDMSTPIPITLGSREDSLNFLYTMKDALVGTTGVSDLVVDRMVAGVEIVTPRLTADEVVTDMLIAGKSGSVRTLLTDGGLLTIERMTDGSESATPIVSFDSDGNATFSGTITAKKIKAEQIEGLEIITDKLTSLTEKYS